MNRFESISKPLMWFMAIVLASFVAGCGGSGNGVPAADLAKAFTSYSLAGFTGTIDESAKTIKVNLGAGSSLTQIAKFTTTGTSVKVGATTQKSNVTSNDFTNPVIYTVTAKNGSKANYTVTVTVGVVVVVAAPNPTPPTLGEAGRYVLLASQSVTTTGVTAISNGDIGILDIARSGIAGFTPTGPAGDFTELTGSTWAGMLSTSHAPDDLDPPFPAPLAYAAPHAAYATSNALIVQSRTDLGIAYTFLAADPNPGVATTVLADPELGGKTLTRGVYKTAVPLLITTALQLDAQGDANSVWIFTTAGDLTTGATGNISFVGGIGQAKNVFWRVGGTTTIASGTTFLGNVFSYLNVDANSGANITGSLFSTTAAVTLIANTVTKAQ